MVSYQPWLSSANCSCPFSGGRFWAGIQIFFRLWFFESSGGFVWFPGNTSVWSSRSGPSVCWFLFKCITGSLISLLWIILLSEVVTVSFVPLTAVCKYSEFGISNFQFCFLFVQRIETDIYLPFLLLFSFVSFVYGRSYRLLRWMWIHVRYLVSLKWNHWLLFLFCLILACYSIPCSVLCRSVIRMRIC